MVGTSHVPLEMRSYHLDLTFWHCKNVGSKEGTSRVPPKYPEAQAF